MNQENYTEAMTNAEIAFGNENYELALEWFKKALEEKPDDLQALSRAGTVCVPLKKFEESFGYFQKALDIYPENGDNYFNMANAYFFRGDYNKAVEFYSEAEQKGCSKEVKPKLYYQLALMCSMRADVKSALVNFQKYEDADETKRAMLDPDVISEKIKLYMVSQDYNSAEKYAIQLIGINPSDFRSYMVYFSILMLRKDYTKAKEILKQAESYSEIDEDGVLALRIQEASILVSQADEDLEHSEEYLLEAYEKLYNLVNIAPDNRKDELKLTLSEVCLKMKRYSDAIQIAESLLPKSKVEEFQPQTFSEEPSVLSQSHIDLMAEYDMRDIDKRINEGKISESIGSTTKYHYDKKGNIVRDYDGVIAADMQDSPDGTNDPIVSSTNSSSQSERKAEFYDRLYFTLLSCYIATEDYENAYPYCGMLKHSKNVYYSYFGRYTEAFSMREIAKSSKKFTMEEVEGQYAEAIAFYRTQMMKGEEKHFSVVFRARMYAESGKFAKAEEMSSLLSPADKTAVDLYINQCREEYEKM